MYASLAPSQAGRRHRVNCGRNCYDPVQPGELIISPEYTGFFFLTFVVKFISANLISLIAI